MTALPFHTAFAAADGFLARLDAPAPTTADSIVRLAQAMPIAEQIALVQRIVEGPRWSAMDYYDSLKLDRALVQFATDVDEALHEEEVRLHGLEEPVRFWR